MPQLPHVPHRNVTLRDVVLRAFQATTWPPGWFDSLTHCRSLDLSEHNLGAGPLPAMGPCPSLQR